MGNIKKALVVPSNTDLNRGDQALTWATLDVVKACLGSDAEIIIYKTNNKLANQLGTNKQTEQLGYKMIYRVLSHPRRNDGDNSISFGPLRLLTWGGRAVFDLFKTLMLLSSFKAINQLGYSLLSIEEKQSYNAFKEVDCLFVKGGGFLHSYGSIVDPYVMYYQLFDVFLASRLGKKIFILPNSIGPLKNKFAKLIVLKALRNTSLLTVRENKSRDLVNSFGLKSKYFPDLGFYLARSGNDFKGYLKSNHGIDIDNGVHVAITARPYRFDGHSKSDELYESYLNALVTCTDQLLAIDNVHVTLVSHTLGPSAHENDDLAIREIHTRLGERSKLHYLFDKELNSQDLQEIYGLYSLMIGTRFHSVIFALNAGTPSLAIAYGGNKAYGIMQEIGLTQYVYPISDLNPEKIASDASFILKDNAFYLEKISVYKETIAKSRKELISVIKKEL
jgi:colanic acid/amylovoran biosynthesis protein